MPPLAEEEDSLEVVPGRGGPEAVSNISTQGQPLPFLKAVYPTLQRFSCIPFLGIAGPQFPISTFMCL
jgi:hypothetical protein